MLTKDQPPGYSLSTLPPSVTQFRQMFRIIDRYVLRQFIQTLLICFLSLAGLYIVIDAFGHLDRFVDYANQHGSLFAILGEYYGYRMLEFFDRMSGVLALIAAMFTVTWIQRHQEMTALLAAGIPRLRVLRPVIVAAIFVSLLAAANRELVMPQVRHKLALDSKNLGGELEADLQPSFDSESNILLAGDKVIVRDQLIVSPSFILPPELATYGKQLSATEAKYLPPQNGNPGGYLLTGVTAPKSILKANTLKVDGRPTIITPPNDPGLQPNQVFVVSGVGFEFLASGSTWRNFASTAELVRELKSPSTDLGANVRVAVHSRLTRPFLDITLLLLGLPLVVSRTNSSPFLAIGLSVGIVAAFMIVVIGCHSLGSSFVIDPALAAWLPLMIFAPLAAGMSDPLRS